MRFDLLGRSKYFQIIIIGRTVRTPTEIGPSPAPGERMVSSKDITYNEPTMTRGNRQIDRDEHLLKKTYQDISDGRLRIWLLREFL